MPCFLRFLCFKRWYNDGNLKCFHDGHAPLGLLAIAVLAACLAVFVFITVIILIVEDVSTFSVNICRCVLWVGV